MFNSNISNRQHFVGNALNVKQQRISSLDGKSVSLSQASDPQRLKKLTRPGKPHLVFSPNTHLKKPTSY